MGWIFSIGILIGGIVIKEPTLIIASGLFAIAGSCSMWLNQIAKSITDKNNKK